MAFWRDNNKVKTLAQSAVQATHTGDTVETTLATITIPGGTMGINDALRVSALWDGTDSANNKSYRVRLAGGAPFISLIATTNGCTSAHRILHNRGAANSQICMPQFGFTHTWSTAPFTSAVDMTSDQDITITVQLASAGETAGLEAYQIELMSG